MASEDPGERLRRADREFREVDEQVQEVGEDRVQAVTEAYREASSLLDRYEGKATGTGGEEFRAFVKLQEEVATFVQDLDDDLLHREAFERMEECMDKRRVSESDFQRAREAIAAPREKADLLAERSELRETYRNARRDVSRRIDELDGEIAELDRLTELGEADLSAPIERIEEPIAAYDEAVEAAFREFKRDRPAREVLSLVGTTADFPLVDFDQPPEDLRQYVERAEAGTEPIPTLLEYSEYSRSKLNHYVDDAAELKRAVATQQTYLQRLDAQPLTVGWPPPSAKRLRFRAEELIAVCARFADESVVEAARTVRDLPKTTDYDHLREAAVAAERLDEDQRRRLDSGDVERDLAELRERREELSELLAELPERSGR